MSNYKITFANDKWRIDFNIEADDFSKVSELGLKKLEKTAERISDWRIISIEEI